jgi:hypothetical protein
VRRSATEGVLRRRRLGRCVRSTRPRRRSCLNSLYIAAGFVGLELPWTRNGVEANSIPGQQSTANTSIRRGSAMISCAGMEEWRTLRFRVPLVTPHHLNTMRLSRRQARVPRYLQAARLHIICDLNGELDRLLLLPIVHVPMLT